MPKLSEAQLRVVEALKNDETNLVIVDGHCMLIGPGKQPVVTPKDLDVLHYLGLIEDLFGHNVFTLTKDAAKRKEYGIEA